MQRAAFRWCCMAPGHARSWKPMRIMRTRTFGCQICGPQPRSLRWRWRTCAAPAELALRTSTRAGLPRTEVKRLGFIFEQRPDHLDAALASIEDDAARKIERRIFGMIAGKPFQAPLAQAEHN